jgi:hypothetical protein
MSTGSGASDCFLLESVGEGRQAHAAPNEFGRFLLLVAGDRRSFGLRGLLALSSPGLELSPELLPLKSHIVPRV